MSGYADLKAEIAKPAYAGKTDDQISATLTTAVVHRFVPESHPSRPKVSGRYLLRDRVLHIVTVADPSGDARVLRSLCTEDASS